MGDRLTVVGEESAIAKVENVVGNAVKDLDEPNLVAVFIGMVLGLLLGSIPLTIPGISFPVKLGLAGGPIVMGILVGAFGPRIHMVTYTTISANLMLRALGLWLVWDWMRELISSKPCSVRKGRCGLDWDLPLR